MTISLFDKIITRWRVLTLFMTCGALSFAQPDDFRATIQRISETVIDLTAVEALLADKDFMALRNHPNPRAALEALVDPSLTEQEKTIAVYSAESASLDHLIAFLEEVIELRKANRISTRLFDTALFPGYIWTSQMTEHNRDRRVIAFLEKAERSGLLTASQTEHLRAIRSGQAKKELEIFRRDQEELRRKRNKGGRRGQSVNLGKWLDKIDQSRVGLAAFMPRKARGGIGEPEQSG